MYSFTSDGAPHHIEEFRGLPLNEKFSIIYLMEESGSPAVERATLALI